MDKHHGPDGLSRHEPAEGKEEEDDPEEWIDHVLSLWVSSWLGGPQFAQVLSIAQALSGNDSNTGNLTMFPVSDKTLQIEEDLMHVERYLHSLRFPSKMDDKASTKFLRLAAQFFLLNGRLWRWQSLGQHQLYVPFPQRFHLV